jgi:hypothetical protein
MGAIGICVARSSNSAAPRSAHQDNAVQGRVRGRLPELAPAALLAHLVEADGLRRREALASAKWLCSVRGMEKPA